MSANDETVSEGTNLDSRARDAILKRFEEAWQRGKRPDIADYLPTHPAATRAILPYLVHIDLEQRLKAGESVGLEQYLQRFPDHAKELQYHLRTRFGSDTSVPFEPLPPCVSEVPEVIGRYRILRLLGEGGMGAVYLAYDPQLERQVALKVPRLLGLDKDGVARFLREARAAAALHHPNICPVYETGEAGGRPYLTMAHIEGQALSEVIGAGLPPRHAAELVRQLALTMSEAHRRGVVHRDLKPRNIMLTARGEPVILDFGLAFQLRPGDARTTEPGTTMGTPAYMAPEQAAGDVDLLGPACDIYSLGVVFFELLTGQLPFRGSTYQIVAQLLSPVPPQFPQVGGPVLDPGLEQICLRALAKQLDQRYASMSDFGAALTNWLEGGPNLGPEPAPRSRPAIADPRVAEEVLCQLRQCGWEKGLEALKNDIAACQDAGRKAALQLLVGWLAGERGHNAEALSQLRAVQSWPSLAGWALAGQALLAMRGKDFTTARALLAEAAAAPGPDDVALRATLAHLRGSVAHHEGRGREALGELHTALELFGPEHFGTGRVLDTLGMAHAAGNNFPLALELYTQALEIKRRNGDDAGTALSHGQLGRLYLDWGLLDQADQHFRTGIELCRRIGDERGEAQLCNHRGQVLLEREQPAEAAVLLAETIRSASNRWPVIEGYGHKDLALAHLLLQEIDEGNRELDRAEALFQAANFVEGTFHIERVRGLLRRVQRRYEESEHCLRTAASQAEQLGEHAQAAACLLALARTLRAREAAPTLVAESLLAALDRAEASRRGPMLSLIEAELRTLAPLEQMRRVCRRLRGAGGSEETAGPTGGVNEAVSVLCVDLQLPAAASPEQSLDLRNHLYADLATVLAENGLAVRQYHGNAFLALARGQDHARRAVAAALAVTQALAEINRPRRLLSWPLWQVCAAVATGTAHLGDVGTFTKCDGTVVGEPVRVAIALLARAEVGIPCVSEATHTAVAALFSFRTGGPRTLALRGAGPQQAWDVMGRA